MEQTLMIGDDVSNLKIYEIINKYCGTEYTGWMKAWYDINSEFGMWFPKIQKENVKPNGAFGGSANWSNTLSEDGRTIKSVNHDENTGEQPSINNTKKILVFGRIGGSFRFLGIFDSAEQDMSAPKTTHIHRRLAKGIDFSTFELFGPEDYGINSPQKPTRVLVDGNERFMCGRCGNVFKIASRCPECGQLVNAE